jgi:hypothetical protein
VAVSATRDPVSATEIGVIEASGSATIDDVMEEFVERVAQMGGNYARVDRFSTNFDWVVRPVTQNYNCGSMSYPATCQQTNWQQNQVTSVRVVGRAFRVVQP